MTTQVKDTLDLTSLKKAYEKLAEYMRHDKREQDQTAIIKAFEYCFELSWKMIKRLLDRRYN